MGYRLPAYSFTLLNADADREHIPMGEREVVGVLERWRNEVHSMISHAKKSHAT